jgi:hypothetical protein
MRLTEPLYRLRVQHFSCVLLFNFQFVIQDLEQSDVCRRCSLPSGLENFSCHEEPSWVGQLRRRLDSDSILSIL